VWKRLLLSGPCLGALLLFAAADPQAAYSAGGADFAERTESPRDGPYPREEEPDARCPVCRAAERVRLVITPLVARPIHRCGSPDYPLVAISPRGRVVSADLQALRVGIGLDVDDVLPGFERAPSIEVRCGATLLGQVPFRLENVAEHVPLPPSVRAKLVGLRGRITWGRSDGGPQALASIWIDPPSTRERARSADVARGLRAEPPWIRRVIEAQLLLDQEFDEAALAMARGVLRERPAEPHAAAIVNAAYGLMGLGDLQEASDLNYEVAYALRERHREAGVVCHLDEPAPPPRSRERRPAGGCGSR